MSCQPIILDVSINGIHMNMEFNIGAFPSILSEKTYQTSLKKTDISPLEESQVTLKTYTVRSSKSWELQTSMQGMIIRNRDYVFM